MSNLPIIKIFDTHTAPDVTVNVIEVPELAPTTPIVPNFTVATNICVLEADEITVLSSKKEKCNLTLKRAHLTLFGTF